MLLLELLEIATLVLEFLDEFFLFTELEILNLLLELLLLVVLELLDLILDY